MEVGPLVNFIPGHVYGESRMELCHNHGDWPLVDFFSIGVPGSAAFLRLPKIMESPRRSSAIIMEIGCHSFIMISMLMKSPRGSSAIIMELRRRTHLIQSSICLKMCHLCISKSTPVYLSCRRVPWWRLVLRPIEPLPKTHECISRIFTSYLINIDMRWLFYVWTRGKTMNLKFLASTQIYFIWIAQSYSFSIREIVVLCIGESEIPHVRLWSH